MVSSIPRARDPETNRLTSDSNLTSKQDAFARLFATGLNGASSAYRLAYKISSKRSDWWVRQAAYNLLRKPHVQALVAKLKAEYDSVKPSLSRATKREILHGMAIDDSLQQPDRQRAIDIDNRMQGEYEERMRLTADVTISLFRGVVTAGQIPWQLAENLPPESVSVCDSKAQAIIDAPVTHVTRDSPDGGEGTLEAVDSSHSKAIPGSSLAKPDLGLTKEGKPRQRARNGKGTAMRASARVNKEIQRRARAKDSA